MNASMEKEIAFNLGQKTYSIHRLSFEDIQAIQELFEKCLDYMLLVDGHAADPHTVAEEFQSVPAGKSYEDKFVFGIVNPQGNLIGLLDTIRGYPDEATWWIDTLLLIPDVRSQGLGEMVVRGFYDYVLGSGRKVIMLGVVDENTRAYQFWNRMGFELVRKTDPEQFGNKTQIVSIMRRELTNL